jgi:hypothetical protein
MKTRSQAKAERSRDPERGPDGKINNCALENGDEEKNCQMCKGACPDRAPAKKDGEVERLSRELDEQLKPAAEKKNPFDWPNANKAREHELREDLVRVVETIFVEDVHAEWQELQKALELGDKRSEHAHVIRALDKVAGRADRAFRLYLTAKRLRDKWEAENEVTWGAMWSEAVRSLQAEKESGSRAKQITDADVRARVAVLHPDEYRAIEERRRSVDLTVKALERHADIWFAKMRNLDSHAGKTRG